MLKNPEKFEFKNDKLKESGEKMGKIEIEPEEDLKFKEILERKSLEYLKTKDSKWFCSEYSGEVASSGYLINKEGKETNFLPSQCIGKDYEKVKEAALREFTEQPEKEVGIKEKSREGIECPNCGHIIPSNVKYCAYCGEKIKKEEPKSEEELGKAREETEEAFEEGEEK